MENKTVCVVGLGYVGLPLADAFSKHLKVIGFDIDEEKTRNLGNNKNNKENLEFTSDPFKIKLIEKDGWYLVRHKGVHRQYKGTLNSILKLKQAGLKEVKEDG